jgi:hypothetical protein
LPFDFSRASSATVVNKAGLVEPVTSGLPRIDFSDDTNGALLLEPQSTNLVTQSEDFGDVSWGKNNTTITSNVAISPDGTLNASKIIEGANLGGKNVTGVSFSASETYTFSTYAKASEREWLMLYFNGGGNGGYYFDIKNGVIGSTLGSNTGTPVIKDVGNGWYRCSVTHLTAAAQSIQIYLADADNGFSYQGDGTSGAYIYGAMLEQQSYATSYIPTAGATATRVQDLCGGAGSASTFNSTEGVLYAEIADLSNNGSNRIISLSNGSQAQRVIIFFSPTSNEVKAICANSSNQCDLSFIAPSVLDYLKIAFKYKENDFALWVNGTKVGTDTNGITSIGLNELAFDNGSGGANFYGKTKNLKVYPTALSDAELEALTTI